MRIPTFIRAAAILAVVLGTVPACSLVDTKFSGPLTADQVTAIGNNDDANNKVVRQVGDPIRVDNDAVVYVTKGDLSCNPLGSQSDRKKCPDESLHHDAPYILLQMRDGGKPTSKHPNRFEFGGTVEVDGPAEGAKPGYKCSLNGNQVLTSASISGLPAAVDAQVKPGATTATVLSDNASYYCGITFVQPTPTPAP